MLHYTYQYLIFISEQMQHFDSPAMVHERSHPDRRHSRAMTRTQSVDRYNHRIMSDDGTIASSQSTFRPHRQSDFAYPQYNTGVTSPGSQTTSEQSRLRAQSPDAESVLSATTLPIVVCKVFVPRIGWGTQLSNGEVRVQFTDSTEVSIQSSPMVVRYTDSKGHTTMYKESDQLPQLVREKLETLPLVMTKLEVAQAASVARLSSR